MRMLLAAVLCTALSGAAFGQAPDTRPALQQRLISVAAGQGYGTEGAQLGLDPGVPQGKSVRYAFALMTGETYLVVGGCDDACSNIALLMTDANTSGVDYSKDGNVITFTEFGAGAHPAFTMTAKKTTTYSIVINVETCSASKCVAGVAVFHKVSAPKPPNFTVDADGAIALSETFKNEVYCVYDALDEDVAQNWGLALSNDTKSVPVDKAVEDARGFCAGVHKWSPRESELAVMAASTQSLLDWASDKTTADNVDYADVMAIRKSLSKVERDKFLDGTWLQDTALVAKLQAALKAKGSKGDQNMLNIGEMAIGASANHQAVLLAWVDFLRAKK